MYSWRDSMRFYDEADSGGGGKTTQESDEEAKRKQEEEDAAVEEQEEATKEDIKDMLDIKPEEEEEEKVEEEEVKEEEAEEETKEEVKEEEEKVEEKEEEKAEEEKEEKEEEEKEDPLLAELGRLTDLIAKSERAPEKPKAEEKVEEEKKEEKKEEPESELMKDLRTPVDIQETEYFKPEMFKESLDEDEVKVLNTVMNQVVEKVRTDTRRQTLQDAMKIFPSMMDYKVQGYVAAQQFWQNNRDLKQMCDKHPKVQTYVEYRATEIQRQNPNWTLGQVYQETEKEVRDLLKDRLSKFKGDQADSSETEKKPALSRKPGAGRKAVSQKATKPTDEQAEILELIEFSKQ